MSVPCPTLRAVPTPIELPSKTQINKCGDLLRDIVLLTSPSSAVDPSAIDHALGVVQAFRNAHGYPMTKVRVGIESMVRTEGISAAVSQRHKRVPRIVRKLVRMPQTSLARLEDIGGCRVVVDSPQDAEALLKRIRRNWHTSYARDPRDYVAYPKDIGYRAVHVVVRRDGRAIEVQVRTRGQQQWADAVEAIDSRLKLNLKDGVGPDSLVSYFSLAGKVIHAAEYAGEIPSDLTREFEVARKAVIDEGFYTG